MSSPPERPEDRPDGADPDTPDEAARFASAWEQIVADLSSGPNAIGGTTQPDPAPQDGAGDAAGPGTSGQRTGGPTGSADGLSRLFEPLRRAQAEPDRSPGKTGTPGRDPEAPDPPSQPAWNPRDWHDEGHFVPPPPPDIPEGTPLSRLAWVGTLGGPAILLGAALTGIDLPQVVSIGAGLAALAGFATLIWLLPDSRGEDSGWDDGAQL